jgi:uncharacterized protein YjeT (DUF2065 family)
MPYERAIDLFAIITFSVAGLSLLAQPRSWRLFFSWLLREGKAGALAFGLGCLAFGALIAAFHRVWFGLLTVVTLAGWFEVVLGAVCLLSPLAGLRVLTVLSGEPPNARRLIGILSLVLGILIFAVLLPGGL